MRTRFVAGIVAFGLIVNAVSAKERIRRAVTVSESAREIPLAYDVDVIVVGGSTRAVSAAQAAAQAGASVFLAAPRPYLGEDICGTYKEIKKTPILKNS
jgi:ribulose 1,5-bisphosphate synthetase/thiazole synthase